VKIGELVQKKLKTQTHPELGDVISLLIPQKRKMGK